MRIARKAFVTHLQHLNCGGLLPDIALTGQFIGVGATVGDRGVMVMSGPVEKADPLSEEIGVTNLELFIKVLQSMEDDEVSLNIEDRFIVVAAHDRTFKLITSAPRVLGTRIDDDMKVKILQLIPATAEWNSLEHRFVEGVLSAAQILKAEVLILTIGPTGGYMEVGDPKINVARFDLPDLKAPSEYQLLLSAAYMVPVLKQLTDFTKAQIVVTGPESVIAVREGGFTYIVSPDRPDAGKK